MKLVRAAIMLFAILLAPAVPAADHTYDLVVYGGTAGGAVAAIAAAREGLQVALIEPGQYIGGMVTGGLGQTDFGKKYVIGGYSREFFERLGKHYGEDISWHFEPHVATETFDQWLKESGVTVFLGQHVERVEKNGTAIQAFHTREGETFRAPLFIDANYEGDLMQRAGVAYTWGREGRAQYDESLAGVVEHSPYHQFDVKVSPYKADGSLLPFIVAEPRAPGEGDKGVQAYNFRICLSSVKENQVPFPKPKDYDPSQYELLRRYLEARPQTELKEMMIISLMPNNKTDVNNKGPVSTDFIGASWGYPEGDYQERAEIWDAHRQYVQGFFYFLANDPSVPKALQAEMNQWGLAKDEFTDNGNWPTQLYVREARRMLGEYVMTQHDIQENREKPDSIGMGSYNSDSHHIQRLVTPEGGVLNEGDVQVPVQPYEIPYRLVLPKADQCSNLLVVCCFSASHVAYSTLRMEPQYMLIGHAAGVAAALAKAAGTGLHQVDIPQLQKRLKEQHQILGLDQVTDSYLNPATLPGVVVDNNSAEVTGKWNPSTSVGTFIGSEYLHQGEGEQGSVRFNASLLEAGRYEVRIAYTDHNNRASNAAVIVNAADGEHRLTLNQRKAPGATAPFASLGTFPFEKTGASVVISTAGADGYVVADAVQWLKVD